MAGTPGLEPPKIRFLANDHDEVITIEKDATAAEFLGKVLGCEVAPVNLVVRPVG